MSDYVVYMHENRINGKKYVGITSGDPELRWSNGCGYYKNKHFYDAIKRYGWDAFDHKILYSHLSKDDACRIEQEMIAKYQTQDKRKGYNLTSGGEHFKHSEESKMLMSERRKGKNQGAFTKEHIEKMKANHAGGAPKVSVRCIDTGEVFCCINDAARATGINKKQISGCCRGQKHYNTAGGYRWEYAEMRDDYGAVR